MQGRGYSPAQGKVTCVQGSGPDRKVGENVEGYAQEVANSSGDRLRGWRSMIRALNGQVQKTGEKSAQAKLSGPGLVSHRIWNAHWTVALTVIFPGDTGGVGGGGAATSWRAKIELLVTSTDSIGAN
jgi:hypothetical protein